MVCADGNRSIASKRNISTVTLFILRLCCIVASLLIPVWWKQSPHLPCQCRECCWQALEWGMLGKTHYNTMQHDTHPTWHGLITEEEFRNCSVSSREGSNHSAQKSTYHLNPTFFPLQICSSIWELLVFWEFADSNTQTICTLPMILLFTVAFLNGLFHSACAQFVFRNWEDG